MVENLLRKALREAQEKDELGLLIWANKKVWEKYASDMEEGNEKYDSALYQIKRGEATTIDVQMDGLCDTGIFAVSAEKLRSSEWYFDTFLNTCREVRMEGPITLVPSNEVIQNV